MLTGIVLWLPRKWSWKQWLRGFRIKAGSGFKRLNYDLHSVLGFYAFPILLLMGTTAMIWGFDWMEQAVRSVSGGESVPKTALPVSDTTGTVKIDPAIPYEKVAQVYPMAATYFVNLPVMATGTINISAYLDRNNLYNRAQVSFDQYSGKELNRTSFKDLDMGGKIIQLNFDLHTGSLWGLPTKIVALLAALIGTTLPITGFLIWLSKKRKTANLIRKRS